MATTRRWRLPQPYHVHAPSEHTMHRQRTVRVLFAFLVGTSSHGMWSLQRIAGTRCGKDDSNPKLPPFPFLICVFLGPNA